MKTIKPSNISHADGEEIYRRIRRRVEIRDSLIAPFIPAGYYRGFQHAHSGCWIYTGRWEDGKGFKKMKWKGQTHYVHRAMYEAVHGYIPYGHVLDHVCRNRSCCNPAHLEPVTVRENTERGNGKWIYNQVDLSLQQYSCPTITTTEPDYDNGTVHQENGSVGQQNDLWHDAEKDR